MPTDEKWEEKRPTIEGLREWDKTFLSMYAINLWDLTVRLEKALDKACEVLEEVYVPCCDSDIRRHNHNATEWKEWCMNDD